MCENNRKSKKKALFLSLIILFSNIFPQINQYPLQKKETNETNATLVARNIHYKEGKASRNYDKKFDYIDQKFNDEAPNFPAMKNTDSKSSLNPILQHSGEEKANKNLNKLELRNLQNVNNYIIGKISGSINEEALVIGFNFSPQPSYIILNDNPVNLESGKLNLTKDGENTIKKNGVE